MTRCVIISSSVSVVAKYWMKNFEIWQDKVDKVYFDNSGNIKVETDNPKITISRYGKYPRNIERLIRESTEDLILIMHDDVFIYKPEILDKYFKLAEEKVVSPKIGPLGSGFLFYPMFLFVSRENILKTNVDLSGGSEGDQGYMLSLELVKAGVEFHSFPDFTTAGVAHGAIMPESPAWVHAQAMSYGNFGNIPDFMIRDEPSQRGNEMRFAWLIDFVGLNIENIRSDNKMIKSWKKQ